MDLLNGYDSSSSTDSVEVAREEQRPVASKPITAAAATAQDDNRLETAMTPVDTRSTSMTFGVTGCTASVHQRNQQQQQQQLQQDVGKKILSLASVLPPHILAALTRSSTTSGTAGRGGAKADRSSTGQATSYYYTGGDDSSDDDDDEVAYGGTMETSTDTNETTELIPNQRHLKRAPQVAAAAAAAATPSSGEFSSFLSALKAAAPTMESGNERSRTVATTAVTKKPPPVSTTSTMSTPESTSTMGDAFLATTVVTRSTKTNTASSSSLVRDIHATEDETTSEQVDTALGKRHALLQPAALDTASDKQPTTLMTTSALRIGRVCAAPPVSMTGPKSAPTLFADRPLTAAPLNYSQPRAETTGPEQPQAVAPAHAATTASVPPVARSRKEMERALRRGQIESVLDDAGLTTMDGADPHDISHMQALAPDLDESTTRSMVRNVPTNMYDASVGGVTASSASMKRGGKNQINQLLAQAAHLERERAQQPLASQVTKTQRANAKRKYGW